jgi:hypothetical protein
MYNNFKGILVNKIKLFLMHKTKQIYQIQIILFVYFRLKKS